jgi:hypothetical protein
MNSEAKNSLETSLYRIKDFIEIDWFVEFSSEEERK